MITCLGQLRKTTAIVTNSAIGLKIPAGCLLNTADMQTSATVIRLYHLHALGKGHAVLCPLFLSQQRCSCNLKHDFDRDEQGCQYAYLRQLHKLQSLYGKEASWPQTAPSALHHTVAVIRHTVQTARHSDNGNNWRAPSVKFHFWLTFCANSVQIECPTFIFVLITKSH